MDVLFNEILSRAVENLSDSLSAQGKVTVKRDADGPADAVISVLGYDFSCVIKAKVTASNYGSVAGQMSRMAQECSSPVLLVTGSITSGLMKKAAADGLNVLDSAGNCEIKAKGTPLLVSICGRKDAVRIPSEDVAFGAAGLKVVFYLLQDIHNVGKTYRAIADATGVALGTVKNVVDSLDAAYILTSERGRFLKNTDELLEQWAIGYNRTLKPKLLLGNMSFIGGKEKAWNETELPDGMQWGGECASFLMDGYLFPEEYEIYSTVPTSALMKSAVAVHDQRGKLRVYKKFWNWTEDMPALLVYADLMGNGDGRCREEAKRIYDKELSYLR
jgi:hypothetical protein